MSSVSVSASGARSLTTTVNDPARTAASMPTKAGDCLSVSTGSLGECRVTLPASAYIEKRVSVHQDQDGKGGTKERVQESWQIVFPHGLGSMFLRATSDTSWPHLSVDVRKPEEGRTPLMEAGEVTESHSLVDLGIATVREGDYGDVYEFVDEAPSSYRSYADIDVLYRAAKAYRDGQLAFDGKGNTDLAAGKWLDDVLEKLAPQS